VSQVRLADLRFDHLPDFCRSPGRGHPHDARRATARPCSRDA
jgi:hypothetical protein